MTIHLHKKHLIVLLAAVVTLGLLYFGAYHLFIKPVKEEISTLQTSKDMYQSQIGTLAENPSTETKAPVHSVELQRKVPVSPMVEQLVLDLEKAETVSNSKIESMTFAESEDALLPPPAQAEAESPEAPADQSGNSEVPSESADAASAQPVNAQGTAELPAAPEGLKRILISLEVTSSHYFDMEAFIAELENQQRVSKVDLLTFNGVKELTSLDQEAEPLKYTLQVSAFYMDNLPDLEGETPKVAAPEPEGKLNPLNTSLVKEKDGE
ncbi:hypothetical protein [Metabacillus idriensis]|uniref:hypothetical protein n=1 Tax=Metabacillus idriensis TaxID=324768 RepID=UPI003D2ADCA4